MLMYVPLVIILLLGSIFGLDYFGLIQYQFFAPRIENVQQKIFNQSPMYIQGMVSDFQNLRILNVN